MTRLQWGRLLSFAATVGIYSLAGNATEPKPITLYWGYLTQIHCKGRLLLSSIGNPKLVTREAFPKELGCGVLVEPEAESGRTDLLLKTSTGDIHRILVIQKEPSDAKSSIEATQLEIWADPDFSKGGTQ